MAVQAPKLLVLTPTGDLIPSRGFYQLEEESLYVQVGRFLGGRHFFSFLEAEHLRLEFDKEGHLLFLELSLPRRHWPVDESFVLPTETHYAELRWLDFREQLAEPRIVTNRTRTELGLLFDNEPSPRFVRLAGNLIAGVGQEKALSSLWIAGIEDDLAGQEIAAFRATLREEQSAMRLTAQTS